MHELTVLYLDCSVGFPDQNRRFVRDERVSFECRIVPLAEETEIAMIEQDGLFVE